MNSYQLTRPLLALEQTRAFLQQPPHGCNERRRSIGGSEMMPAMSLDPEGLRIRREVLGDEHVDRAIERTTPFTQEFQELITRYAWGEIWARPGLDRRTRSCITITALIALGRDEELAMHVRTARRNGLTVDEIKEVLLQAAVYCGVPAANSAFAIAQQVLDEEA
jgi:4-carboxymuconolactone decarboxylase